MVDRKQDAPGAPDDADGPASGTVAHPIAPDEAQSGDRSEAGAGLGGPVDVFPGRRQGGVGQGGQGAPMQPDRTGPAKRRD